MGNEILVLVELPGVCKDDINIDFTGKKLVIFGEKKEFKAYDECQMLLHQESEFGQFKRRIKIPKGVQLDESNIKAKFENGLLELRFPKPQNIGKEVKKINIQGVKPQETDVGVKSKVDVGVKEEGTKGEKKPTEECLQKEGEKKDTEKKEK